jgi:hypothetical protein
MAKPAKPPQPLHIVQGDDYEYFFRIGSRATPESALTYFDMTGWTGRSQIRANADSGSIAAAFTVTCTAQGALLEMDRVLTETLPGGTTMVFDVELTDAAGKRRTWISGDVQVIKEITK